MGSLRQSSVVAGQNVELDILPVDGFGNLIEVPRASEYGVTLEGSLLPGQTIMIEGQISRKSQGSGLIASVAATISGQYTLRVFLAGLPDEQIENGLQEVSVVPGMPRSHAGGFFLSSYSVQDQCPSYQNAYPQIRLWPEVMVFSSC